MSIYDHDPERALLILDSAEMLGNLTPERASLFHPFALGSVKRASRLVLMLLLGHPKQWVHVGGQTIVADVIEITLGFGRVIDSKTARLKQRNKVVRISVGFMEWYSVRHNKKNDPHI